MWVSLFPDEEARETNGVGAYLKPELLGSNPAANDGAIYSVVGSSGQISGGSLNHAAHFLSLNNLGSMVLDITTNRLDAIFLRETGVTSDYFTIIKTNFAPVTHIVAGNGWLNINSAGIPGFGYDVQRSTDLVIWLAVTNLIAPPGGLFQYFETNPPSPSFYRLRQH